MTTPTTIPTPIFPPLSDMGLFPLPAPDAWMWRFHYTDGTAFSEFDPQVLDAGTPQERLASHGFAEVDIARVAAIELVAMRHGLTDHLLLLDDAAQERPIFFRHTKQFLADGVVLQRLRVTVIGAQRTSGTGKRARNLARYTAFLENGVSISTTDPQQIYRIGLNYAS